MIVCSGHTVLFLCLCDLGNKECHKSTTRNCVPQRMGVYGDDIHKFVLYLVCFGIKCVLLQKISDKINIEFYTCLYYNEDNT